MGHALSSCRGNLTPCDCMEISTGDLQPCVVEAPSTITIMRTLTPACTCSHVDDGPHDRAARRHLRRYHCDAMPQHTSTARWHDSRLRCLPPAARYSCSVARQDVGLTFPAHAYCIRTPAHPKPAESASPARRCTQDIPAAQLCIPSRLTRHFPALLPSVPHGSPLCAVLTRA